MKVVRGAVVGALAGMVAAALLGIGAACIAAWASLTYEWAGDAWWGFVLFVAPFFLIACAIAGAAIAGER